MEILFALILALVTPAPLQRLTPTPSPPLTVGLVSLGRPAADLIAQRGEPYVAQTNGENGVWAYFSPGGSAIQFVSIRRGYVTGTVLVARPGTVAIHEDLSLDGVHIGDAYASLPAYANTGSVTMDGIVYSFSPSKDKSAVWLIGARMTDDRVALLPSLSVMPLLHDGSSMTDAIVVRAANDVLGTAIENSYIAGHNYCAKPDQSKVSKQSLVHDGGKTYDQIDTSCGKSDKTKTYFFDITNSFGKQ